MKNDASIRTFNLKSVQKKISKGYCCIREISPVNYQRILYH